MADTLLHLHRQCLEEMVLHNQAVFAQQAAVSKLGRQSVQTVSSQLQLSELDQLTDGLWQHGERIVPQTQHFELGASEQRLGQHLQLVGVDGEVLEVMKETHVWREQCDGVVAHVQVPQFRQSEQGRRQGLQFIVGEVERLQRLDLADGGWDGDNFVVPQFKARQPLEVLEADDLLYGSDVVRFQVKFL